MRAPSGLGGRFELEQLELVQLLELVRWFEHVGLSTDQRRESLCPPYFGVRAEHDDERLFTKLCRRHGDLRVCRRAFERKLR